MTEDRLCSFFYISLAMTGLFWGPNRICVFRSHPLQQPYEQPTSVSMPQHGQGFGYNQAHFHPGHSQQAVMMRQKSIGNCKCHRDVSAQHILSKLIFVTICTSSQV